MGRISAGRWGRLGAAVVLGGLMSFTAAGVAAAAETKTTPVNGTAGAAKDSGYSLFGKNDGENIKEYKVALITLTIGGNTVAAYCIDLHHDLKHDVYQETTWDSSKVKDLKKVQWILGHSVPNVEPAEVLNAAGVTTLAPGTEKDEQWRLVYAATQGAIWHHSDDLEVVDHAGRNYDALKRVYDYLVKSAGEKDEPAPTLSITPASATGEIGSKLGPYTVKSSGPATLSVSGGKIVDANGAEVTGTVKDGGKFWLTSDAAGKVTVEAKASGNVPTGRVFTYPQGPNKHQKVILAGAAPTELIAHAAGTFTPKAAPAPTLPVTGASAVGAAIGGLVLLGGGGVLVAMLRRRRINFTA